MARKRIVNAPLLKSWNDVNNALREIAVEQISIQDIEGDMNKQIIGIKKIADETCKPHISRISQLEHEIKAYTEEHREELGKTKTRLFTFGNVGYRLATSVVVSSKADVLEGIIRKLKARAMNDCIITKETVDKVALKKYGRDTVNAIGVKWKQEDAFGYDVFLDKVEKLRNTDN
ncbi:MAG: host-nuclease inhibitor Gam family protein [Oscillospiraceae bacterium]